MTPYHYSVMSLKDGVRLFTVLCITPILGSFGRLFPQNFGCLFLCLFAQWLICLLGYFKSTNLILIEHDLGPRMMPYWVILKKVSFGVFSVILVSKGEKNFPMKSKNIVLSLSKFS